MAARHGISLTRRVLNAVYMLGTAQAAGIFCSVVRTKLVAIWLDRAGVGLNAIFSNGSNLISTATQLNIRDSAVRDVSAAVTDGERELKNAVIRRWSLILGVVGALLMIAVSPLLSISSFGGSLAYTGYFAALAPFVFFSACSAGEFAIMQGMGQLRSLARANIAAAVSGTLVAVPLFYFFRLDAIVAVIDLYALAGYVSAYIWRERPRSSGVRLDRKTLWANGRGFLTLGLSMSFSLLLTVLMQYILAAYINIVGGESALGIYQSGYTLVNSYIGVIFSAIALEYYPRLVRFINAPRLCRTVVSHEMAVIVTIIAPVAVLFICASDFIVTLLYSSKFAAVLPMVSLAIIGAVFRGVSLCFAYRILAAGDSKAYIFTESMSVIVGLALNITCYHYWSYTGLGVAYILWYAFYAALTAMVCRRRYGLKTPGVQLCNIAFAVAVTVLAIVLKNYVAWWFPALAILSWLVPMSLRRLTRR